MFLRTEISSSRKIIGMRANITLINDTTPALFRAFMPRRSEIASRSNHDILCVQNYPESFFSNFNPETPFEKWAAVEVSDFNAVPEGMETFTIPEGLYAVFLFKGTTAEAAPFFQNIYMNWFPASAYVVDNRPHFDVLGEKYKHDSTESEEEIWIPVRTK